MGKQGMAVRVRQPFRTNLQNHQLTRCSHMQVSLWFTAIELLSNTVRIDGNTPYT